MLGRLRRSKPARTVVLASVAGLVAMAAFAVANGAGLRGLVGTILAVAAGLSTGFVLERLLAPD